MKEGNDGYKFKIRKRDDGIIAIKTWEKEWTEEGALRFRKELFDALSAFEGKVKMITDATEAGFGPTAEARKIYAEIMKSPKIGKSAIFGLKTPNRVIVSFLLRVSGKKDLKVFKDEEKALKWLKE